MTIQRVDELVRAQNERAGFEPFNTDDANRIVASSYVIPFLDDERCVVVRREQGDWVLPGGTLEPGETWEQAGRRELLEETGCRPDDLHPIGLFRLHDPSPRRPHLPHPEQIRVVSWANVERVAQPSDPDANSRIAEIRVLDRSGVTALLSGVEPPFLHAIYELAFDLRNDHLVRLRQQ